MNKIQLVSPCCGRLLAEETNEVAVTTHIDEVSGERWFGVNVVCCGEEGNGMYQTREAAEADIEKIRQAMIEASIRYASNQLQGRHEDEWRNLREEIKEFRIRMSEDTEGGGGYWDGRILGYSEACGYRN